MLKMILTNPQIGLTNPQIAVLSRECTVIMTSMSEKTKIQHKKMIVFQVDYIMLRWFE